MIAKQYYSNLVVLHPFYTGAWVMENQMYDPSRTGQETLAEAVWKSMHCNIGYSYTGER